MDTKSLLSVLNSSLSYRGNMEWCPGNRGGQREGEWMRTQERHKKGDEIRVEKLRVK